MLPAIRDADSIVRDFTAFGTVDISDSQAYYQLLRNGGPHTMLIIGRREGEALHIGDDIEIMVLQIAGGQVRIGIRAPDTVRVTRAELDDRPATRKPEPEAAP